MSDMIDDASTYACFNGEHDLCTHETDDGCRCQCHKREALLDELQDIVDDTAKKSRFENVAVSNPREIAEAVLVAIEKGGESNGKA